MARPLRVESALEDVNGSFARFIDQAPKVARKYLATAVFLTTGRVYNRMEANAPVLDGDLKVALQFDTKGLSGRAGILKGEGENDMAHIALYNEFRPNEQAFMRPAAKAEQGGFVAAVTRALEQCERDLSS
jgi:hypothetical protein